MIKTIISAIGILAMVAVPLQSLCLGIEAGRPYFRRLFAQPAVLVRFFLATFVIVPALAVILALGVPMPWPVWAGLALVSITPPGLGLSQKSLKLTGDDEIGFAWQALALMLSLFAIPLLLMLMQQVFNLHMKLAFVPVLEKILLVYLLPLVAGFLVNRIWPETAQHALARILKPAATAAQISLVILVLIIAVPMISALGSVPLLLIFGFAACALIIGHAMGGPVPEYRPLLAAALAMRWPAPALVIAQVNASTREIAPVLLAYLISAAFLIMLYGRWVKMKN